MYARSCATNAERPRHARGHGICRGRAAGTADLDTQLRVEKIILNMSKDQLLRDRSLMKMQGWRRIRLHCRISKTYWGQR